MIGHKTLMLYDMDGQENPVELAFQARYGDIVSYKWYVQYMGIQVSRNVLFVRVCLFV